jgi:hypothetical protein
VGAGRHGRIDKWYVRETCRRLRLRGESASGRHGRGGRRPEYCRVHTAHTHVKPACGTPQHQGLTERLTTMVAEYQSVVTEVQWPVTPQLLAPARAQRTDLADGISFAYSLGAAFKAGDSLSTKTIGATRRLLPGDFGV